jgi:hypothetical protein
MIQDDIIRIAREAGLYEDGKFFVLEHAELARFAALIAEAKYDEYLKILKLQQESYEREIKIEVETEREACANICDGIIYHDGKEADICAAAIRERNQA